ncbi:uncharacterized protein [Paramormyrops kingsleyae]|uniref:uncharacterized protein isoform X1 n=1 Tax=Paramormyrops kingsleyae TaxID=1676925 RepID=UPI003B977766
MGNRMDVQNLFEHIKFISEEAAHILREAVPYGTDILTLTMEDLNELLPGECNFQLRRHIMGLIDVFLQITNDNAIPGKGTDPAGEESESDQKTIVSPMEHSTGSSGDLIILCEDHALEVQQSNVDHTNVDMEEKPMAAQDGKRPNITSDSEVPRTGTDPAGEESESDQKMIASPMDHFTGSSGDHAPEVLQSNVDHTNVDMEEKPMAAQDGKRSNITSDSEVPRNDTDPAGEESESDQKMIVSPMDHSTGSFGVKVHVLVTGEIFNTHETFMQKLKLRIELCSAESSNIILVFCPVVSHIRTDMEAAMARVTVNKPVILVFMHHCHHPSHMTNITVQPCRSNMQVVHCAFHESRGLLECQENEQVVKAVRSTLLRYVDSHDEVPHPKMPRTQPGTVQQQMSTQGDNEHSVYKVKVHMLLAGETFQTHETFIQKLKLQIELCSAESSSIILVFCTVVSQIRTDMEAAMARVTEDKPVILVFMHHCHSPSHMTDITVQLCRGNIVQVVHCAFHETKGLLECKENEQVVKAVRSTLLRLCRNVDVQAEVPLTQSKIEQQPMAAQNANRPIMTNEVPRTGTKPMTEERESGQRTIVPAKGHSTGPYGGTSFLSKTGRFFSKSNWNISSVKVHMLLAGETFQTHETFIQKLKLQIELCSAESSSIILVFCTVVSQIRTDMEAAMARVTEDKPVILVFMHHCHNPSHMTDITVQPSRSNIVQVAHCAFHETKGLLECKENEQVVKAVRSTLLRDYRNVDVQAEVPLTQSEIEQQPVAAQNANRPIMTNEVPRTGTKPMTEERESDQRTIVPAKGHSTGPSGGTSFLSKTGRFFSKSNWNISSDSVKSSTGISRLNPNPNRVNSSSLVKVHVLVAGETFQAHETFIQKLKLQIERHSAESCNIILVFCPVVSQIGTDMEAAMARVTEDKPVILVFMHHCHNPSHMTNTTVQPTRSNIEQVVHCAFHETTGLLRCQENEQAVADVQAMLMKHK